MERTHIEDLKGNKGKEVLLKGWVNIRRDHGKLIFIDLRDATGRVQMVILPEHAEAQKQAQEVRPEWLIEVKGMVNERPEKMVKKDEQNGDIEIEATEINIISESETPPFELSEDTIEVGEETRLKYRYLDLRSERMQKNMRIRSEWVQKCREYLFKRKFTEIETPLLTESTPEGSRDFVVPSRLNPGKFYALPQSPQQYKQLLMIGGFERYFQIARAIRDEDLRGDRGFEHTQVDIETSFATQDEVLNLVEGMITEVVESMGYVIKEKPFPRISYKDAMEKHGADKFDLRTEEEKEKGILAYAWVVDFPFFEKTNDGKWTFSHNPFSMPKEEHIQDLLDGKNIENIITQQYDLVCNGFESAGGSIRSHRIDILKAVYKVMGNTEEETEEKIGHMLEAFKYGTPPHGGIAAGLGRILMVALNEKSIREVVPFPTTGKGNTAVMDAPSKVAAEQLRELGLKLNK